MVPAPSHQSSPVVYLKARSSDRSCFFYTLQTSLDWWTCTTFKSICTQMTHVYCFCDTEDSASFQNALSACIDDISVWMRSNCLQLNAAKTELMSCASDRRMHQVLVVLLRVGADNVTPVSSVRDLCIYLDADASMTTHISRTAASCFGILH